MAAELCKISPCLWFDGAAEPAARWYTELFADSGVDQVVRRGFGGSGEPGSVMTVQFRLAGQSFLAVNGGPHYEITPAVSLYVACADQAEIDRLWSALLSGGGAALQGGWVTDRFGVTWQIAPRRLQHMLSDPDARKAARAAEAMREMAKLDLAALEQAYAG